MIIHKLVTMTVPPIKNNSNSFNTDADHVDGSGGGGSVGGGGGNHQANEESLMTWDLDVLCHHNNFISWVIGHFFDQLLLVVVVMQVVVIIVVGIISVRQVSRSEGVVELVQL